MTACADAEKERLIRTTVPTYDPATGKLTQLTYDADRNGRVDTWTSMDGTRPLYPASIATRTARLIDGSTTATPVLS